MFGCTFKRCLNMKHKLLKKKKTTSGHGLVYFCYYKYERQICLTIFSFLVTTLSSLPIIQLANCLVEAQCRKSRVFVNSHIRMRRGGDLLWQNGLVLNGCWCQMDWLEYFRNCQSSRNYTTRCEKQNWVKDSSVGRNALGVNVRGKWTG